MVVAVVVLVVVAVVVEAVAVAVAGPWRGSGERGRCDLPGIMINT
jgi:hypothetical protein